MTISIIVAVAENGVIGKDNGLEWHLPADFKHFKELTTGHHLIMGRKTYESIGRPLPGRTTIIITRQKNYVAEGCKIVHSLREALDAVKNDSEVFIAGGAEIYKQALLIADKIYLTRVHHVFKGDAYFPEINEKNWELKEKERHEQDDKNPYPFTFYLYQK